MIGTTMKSKLWLHNGKLDQILHEKLIRQYQGTATKQLREKQNCVFFMFYRFGGA